MRLNNNHVCLFDIHFLFKILTATFNDKKKETVCKDQSSEGNIELPANLEGLIGNLVGLEEAKEVSEGDYEEIDNILNTPFTMEYNMSYSTATQTAV